MCNYQGYEFGAGSYPDSVCIEGRLYDADACDNEGNLYEPDDDIPCPMCKPREAVMYWAERNYYGLDDKRQVLANAYSLVNDIRANRGAGTVPSKRAQQEKKDE